jgi:hypothetical protein
MTGRCESAELALLLIGVLCALLFAASIAVN